MASHKSYNPDLHSSLPFVHKRYKKLLDGLRIAHKRGLRDELEYIIEEAAKQAGVSVDDVVVTK